MNDFSRIQKMAGFSAIILTVATLFNVVTLFASVNYDTTALFSDPCAGYLAHPTGFWGFSEGISSGDSSFPSKLGSVYFMNMRWQHLDDRF